jgi:hypothetical protein
MNGLKRETGQGSSCRLQNNKNGHRERFTEILKILTESTAF